MINCEAELNPGLTQRLVAGSLGRAHAPAESLPLLPGLHP